MKALTFLALSIVIGVTSAASVCVQRTHTTGQTRREALQARNVATRWAQREASCGCMLSPHATTISQSSQERLAAREIQKQASIQQEIKVLNARAQWSKAINTPPEIVTHNGSPIKTPGRHIIMGCILLVGLSCLTRATATLTPDLSVKASHPFCLPTETPKELFTQEQGWNNQCFLQKNQCNNEINEYSVVRQALRPVLLDANITCARLPSPSHTSIMYKCAPQNSVVGKNYIVRVMHRNTDSCENENAAQHKVLALDSGVTPTIYSSTCSSNASFIVMDFIPSRSLTLPEINQQSMLRQTSALFQTLTDISLNNINKRDIFAEIRASSHQLMLNKVLLPVVQQVMEKIEIIEHKIDNAHLPYVFSHGELHPRNLFCHNGKVMAVDWEFAAAMPRFYDLAYFSVLSCLNPTNDAFLLTQYLGKAPNANELEVFGLFKLVVRASDAFYFLSSLPPEAVNKFWESHFGLNKHQDTIKNYTYYENIFAEDLTIIPAQPTLKSLRFKFESAIAGLRMFLKEISYTFTQ